MKEVLDRLGLDHLGGAVAVLISALLMLATFQAVYAGKCTFLEGSAFIAGSLLPVVAGHHAQRAKAALREAIGHAAHDVKGNQNATAEYLTKKVCEVAGELRHNTELTAGTHAAVQGLQGALPRSPRKPREK